MGANAPLMDVTGTVDLSRPREVALAVDGMLGARFGASWDGFPVMRAFDDMAAAYAGVYDGFLACDTPYHDLRHALDVALAVARLIDGWQDEHAGGELGFDPPLAAVGTILALLHDVGFLRHRSDEVRNGAILTAQHEARSVAFARRYLLQTRLAPYASLARLIEGTRVGASVDDCAGPDARHLALARMIATADLMAQFADRCYLEKCRDFLYEEFAHAGLARGRDGSNAQAPYSSPDDLLGKTTGFWQHHVAVRLEQDLDGVHWCFARHFRGPDPYRAAIERNIAFLGEVVASGDFSRLRRRPEALFDALPRLGDLAANQ